MIKRVQQAEAQLHTLQRANDEAQARLADAGSRRDAERTALQSELDLLTRELERRTAAESELRVSA